MRIETTEEPATAEALALYAGIPIAFERCRLERIDRNAYPELPEEIQLLWYKDI